MNEKIKPIDASVVGWLTFGSAMAGVAAGIATMSLLDIISMPQIGLSTRPDDLWFKA